ncbi:TIP41-like protein [Diaphorina citri]|jgi:TIP41-like family.|uniref:TIP41-like protein n=1 Tax=Diaphorina citri TaxID=121845 RepID=A0A1S3DHQ9_DIACI|nr:TIP41-like protein [Diaphorina citri]
MATKCESYEIELWKINASTSHILASQCSELPDCDKSNSECDFCRYSTKLKIPHLPEMVFAGNILKLSHAGGCSLEFNAFDALSSVIVGEMPLQIACSEAWKSSRRSTGFTESHIHPFDWTYSTDYAGTLVGDWAIEKTSLQIDLEKLKQREKIHFYQDLILYEDELHDNGIAKCSVKIRVMSSGFFILLRFFLRVDDVLVRMNDTRLYHEYKNNFVLREISTRQASVKELRIPQSMISDEEPNLVNMLPLIKSETHKLMFQ